MWSMSAIGTKRTFRLRLSMSAFGSKADKYERCGISPLQSALSQDQAAPLWQADHHPVMYLVGQGH
jgi:hypothetical protein